MFTRMNGCAMPVPGGYAVTAELPNAGLAIVYCKREPEDYRRAVRECYARWSKAQGGQS